MVKVQCAMLVVVLRRAIWYLVLLAMMWSLSSSPPSASSEDDTSRVGASEGRVGCERRRRLLGHGRPGSCRMMIA
jgi:hypothetical protein